MVIAGSVFMPLFLFLLFGGYVDPGIAEIILYLIILTAFHLGLAFLHMEKETQQRKKKARLFLILGLSIFSIGMFNKQFAVIGSNMEVMFGTFMICFSFLPLFVKTRYEKWKSFTQSGFQTLLLSLGDLLSIILLLMGGLFKFMHWPAWYIIAGCGVVLFILSFSGWNRVFKHEVRLRKETEDKLVVAFEELKNKHLLIEEKNREITDSINYAKRIQSAILPDEKEFTKIFKEAFVLLKPKDIVSGDFYWIAEIQAGVVENISPPTSAANFRYIFIATADCTGHGVPGGFMSMLGSSFLNEIVLEKNIIEPAEILNELREKIISALKQTGTVGENKDGMDIVLTRYDLIKNELVYSSANNDFYIIRNGELQFFKPDKQPIGFFNDEKKSFTQHMIELKKGDCVYTFTDGYADQFGGNKGKKLKYKNLENILLQNHLQSLQKQKEIYNSFIENWRGELEQNDDICLIGIKI